LAGDLVREAMPGIEPDTVDWRPLDPRAPKRVARRNVLLTFLVGLAVTFFSPGWGWVFLPLVALAGWIGLRSVRRCAWGFDRGPDGERRAIFFRSGPFDQRESLVPLGKIQCVSLTQTPFDRRWRMATLRVDTAGASAGGHRVEVPYLELGLARELADDLAAGAADTTFLW
ncbi:MAG: PH domain-containing protein, partial [Acidobacteriota bacterium]